MKIADYRKVRSVMPKSEFFFGTPENAQDLLTLDAESSLRQSVSTSAIRCALREEPCTQIPEIRGLVAFPENKWGDHFMAELCYDGQHLVTLGGKLVKVIGRAMAAQVSWSVYAD